MCSEEILKMAAHFESLAKKWKKMPKGWDAKSRKKFYESIGGFDKCLEEMKGKVSDPGAFCASLKDQVKGKGWRKKKRKKRKNTKS